MIDYHDSGAIIFLHNRARRPDICNKEPNPWAVFMWVKPISYETRIDKPENFQSN